MKKIIFTIAFLSLLQARDNPFLPVKHFENPTQQEYFSKFTSHEFNLPPNAKIIENIIINYINIDGSVKSLKLDINQSFDWHDTFLISLKNHQLEQNNKNQNNTIMSIDDTQNIVLKEEEQNQKPKEEINITKDINQIDDKPQPNTTEQITKQNQISTKELDLFGLAKAKYSTNFMKITSEYELLRYFTLPNPERIVLDFKKTIGYKPKFLDIEDSYFTKVSLGSHNGFFRLVFFPDAKYDIKITPKKEYIEVIMH